MKGRGVFEDEKTTSPRWSADPAQRLDRRLAPQIGKSQSILAKEGRGAQRVEAFFVPEDRDGALLHGHHRELATTLREKLVQPEQILRRNADAGGREKLQPAIPSHRGGIEGFLFRRDRIVEETGQALLGIDRNAEALDHLRTQARGFDFQKSGRAKLADIALRLGPEFRRGESGILEKFLPVPAEWQAGFSDAIGAREPPLSVEFLQNGGFPPAGGIGIHATASSASDMVKRWGMLSTRVMKPCASRCSSLRQITTVSA
jgi:hypothetical protein